jgi:hypothetical protein
VQYNSEASAASSAGKKSQPGGQMHLAEFNSESPRVGKEFWRSVGTESECSMPVAEGSAAFAVGSAASLPEMQSPKRRNKRREKPKEPTPAHFQSEDTVQGPVFPATASGVMRLPRGFSLGRRGSRDSLGSAMGLPKLGRRGSKCSMGSAASWLSVRSWFNPSKAPSQSCIAGTSAMEMVEHDCVRSYDLRGLFGGMLRTSTESQTLSNMSLSWNFKRWSQGSQYDDRPSWMRRCARELVQKPAYEVCVMLLIVANSVFLGCQVQHEALYREPVRWNFEVEAFFCVAFTLELFMKIYAGGWQFFFGSEATWNHFDVLVVVLMLVDMVVSLSVDTRSGFWAQASVLRILRVLRVVRFLRSVRQLRFFSQLRIMIKSIMFSLKPLLWASTVLAGMFFVFGVCLTQGVVDYLQKSHSWDDDSSADLRTYFGSLERSALSLFKAMSGGINWGELFEVLSLLDVHFRCVFLFFVLFAVFGAANVVTGIFVEIANHWAHHDSHTQVQAESEQKLFCIKALLELFNELDPSGHGTVTLEGMLCALREGDERLVNSFHALRLEVMDVRTLFLLLDRDRKGFISTEEFLLGCFRLKGEAKTLDIMKLQYQSEWVMHNLVRMQEKLDDMSNRPSRDPPASDAMPRDESCLFRNLSAQVTSHQLKQVLRRSQSAGLAPSSGGTGMSASQGESPQVSKAAAYSSTGSSREGQNIEI